MTPEEALEHIREGMSRTWFTAKEFEATGKSFNVLVQALHELKRLQYQEAKTPLQRIIHASKEEA